MTRSETESALVRLRESAQFYLKLDFALLTGVLAVASFFKIEGPELLLHINSYISLLFAIAFLIAYGFALEFFITVTRNELPQIEEEGKFSRLVSNYNRAYAFQVLAHLVLLGFITGFIYGVVDCLHGQACPIQDR